MTTDTPKMLEELASPDAYPLLLLGGRFAYRKAWAMRPRWRTESDWSWRDHGDDRSFARIGLEYVSADFGRPLSTAPTRRKKTPSFPSTES